MSDLDRSRAARLMQAADLDALLLFQPEAFRYATGLRDGVAGMWRRGGAAVALVPSDAGAPLAAILSDHQLHFGPAPKGAIELITHPIWIDYVDFSDLRSKDTIARLQAAYAAQALGGARPESFDRGAVLGLVRDLLAERGLLRARIGVDLEFLPAADLAALSSAIPEATIADGSEVLRRLRMVKSAREIACLRKANAAADAGLVHMARHARVGMTRSRLDALWREGAAAAAQTGGFEISGDRAGIAVGPNLVLADPVLAPGDLIKADMGVAVDGYLSDGTRSYSMGAPAPAIRALFRVIETGFEAGLDAIRPGARFGDVHAAVLAATARAGLPAYCRGHFGHSIGASCGSEEWPFISAGNPEPILPGMVLAFEVPFYLHGIGAMMIEDQILVAESGIEVMGKLPRGLADLTDLHEDVFAAG